MAKKVSKHTKVTYALIVASLAAIAFGMFRFREGFQVDFTNKEVYGIRVYSSDFALKDETRDPALNEPNTRIRNLTTGNVVYSVSDTREITTNTLTDSKDLNMYDIRHPYLKSNFSNDMISRLLVPVIDKPMSSNTENPTILKNIIFKNTSSGEITYYPTLKDTDPKGEEGSEIKASSPSFFERLKKWELTSFEQAGVIGGGIILVLFLIFLISLMF